MLLRPDIEEAFRLQAGWCRELGSPFTASLLDALASEGGAALADVVRDWRGDPVRDVLALRVAGALHAAALSDTASELSEAYPQPRRPGRPQAVAAAASRVILSDPERFGQLLRSAPQTNETRRSLGLFPALLLLTERFARPVQLYELGASAGLNLMMDRFSYRTPAWRFGTDAPVRIEGEWRGPAPPARAPEVIGRAGCDLNPLDPADREDRLRLRSYVWADQFERTERLDAALDLAARDGVRVERADAGGWLAERLPARPEGVLSVVYHSLFWQYPPEETRAAISATLALAGASADERTPLAWLRLEPDENAPGSRPSGHQLELTVWPGGEHQVLGLVHPHGAWVEWRS